MIMYPATLPSTDGGVKARMKKPNVALLPIIGATRNALKKSPYERCAGYLRKS